MSTEFRLGYTKSHTRNLGQKLPGKALGLADWERKKSVVLQEVKDARAQKVGHYAGMITKFEVVPELYTATQVLWVVLKQGLQHPQLLVRFVIIQGDLECAFGLCLSVIGFVDPPRDALA